MGEAFITRRGGNTDIPSRILNIINNISYSGQMSYEVNYLDDNLYVIYTLESSGTLTTSKTFKCDLWLCGAGGGGAASHVNSSDSIYGGGGGGGGYVYNISDYTLPASAVVAIGAGGAGGTTNNNGDYGTTGDGSNGGATTFGNLSALGGYGAIKQNGANGGSGGGGGGITYNTAFGSSGTGAGITTKPFLSDSYLPYCAGGTGGIADTFQGGAMKLGTMGGSNGSDGTTIRSSDPADYGGGYPYYEWGSTGNAHDGWAYGAGGGGGSCAGNMGGNMRYGGAGYQGCAMFRIAV